MFTGVGDRNPVYLDVTYTKLKLKFLNFGIFRIKRILKQYAFATILNWRNGLALK